MTISKVVIIILSLIVLALSGAIKTDPSVYSQGKAIVKSVAMTAATVIIPLRDSLLFRDTADKIQVAVKNKDCRFCDFSGASLDGADLSEVDLRYSKMVDSQLASVAFRKSLLWESDLSGSKISHSDFHEVDMHSARLRTIHVTNTKLSNATFENADLTGSRFQGGTLAGSNLKNTILEGAHFKNINLSDVNLQASKLNNASLVGVDLRGSDLTRSDLRNIYLSGVLLDHALLREVNLTNADFSGQSLVSVDFGGATFTGVSLRGADLTGANLSGLNLSGLDLRKTNFNDTFLYNTNLSDANLEEASFDGAKTTGAKTDGANLNGAKISADQFVDRGEMLTFSKLYDVQQPTSLDIKDGVGYLTMKEGGLYYIDERRQKTLLQDFSEIPGFVSEDEAGLLSVVHQDSKLFVSYTVKRDDRLLIIIDEIEMEESNLGERKQVIEIDLGTTSSEKGRIWHVGGTLIFDKSGRLYLSIGESQDDELAQNLESLNGKIIRLNLESGEYVPEIIAYGLRNPWKISFSENGDLYVADVGRSDYESLYVVDDVDPMEPYNMGWPYYEGLNVRVPGRLSSEDRLWPIYVYKTTSEVGRATVGGFFLEEEDMFLLGDWFRKLRLLRVDKQGVWREMHFQETPDFVFSLGLDRSRNEIYMLGMSAVYLVEVDQSPKS